MREWRAHFRDRVTRQAVATGDHELVSLLEEVLSEPATGAPETAHAGAAETARLGDGILGPLGLRAPDGTELSLLGMFATFDTPFEVTASELAVELFFPADDATAAALRSPPRTPG